MYLIMLIVLIITAVVSASDILFGLQDMNESMALFVKISRALFFLSILFFVLRKPTQKKD